MKEALVHHVRHFVTENMGIISITDGVEILLFSSIIYALLSWLNSEYSRAPLLLFLGYFGLMYLCSFFHLSIVALFLLVCSPVISTIILIMHQAALAKKVITHKKIQPATQQLSWIEELTRSLMHLVHQGFYPTIIIERDDQLSSFISIPFAMETALSHESLSLFITHMPPAEESDNQTLYIHNGTILGLQATIEIPSHLPGTPTIELAGSTEYNMLQLTSTTDAIIVKTQPQTNTFDCMVQGTSIENLSASQLLAILKRLIVTKENKPIDTESFTHVDNKKHTDKQKHT